MRCKCSNQSPQVSRGDLFKANVTVCVGCLRVWVIWSHFSSLVLFYVPRLEWPSRTTPPQRLCKTGKSHRNKSTVFILPFFFKCQFSILLLLPYTVSKESIQSKSYHFVACRTLETFEFPSTDFMRLHTASETGWLLKRPCLHISHLSPRTRLASTSFNWYGCMGLHGFE